MPIQIVPSWPGGGRDRGVRRNRFKIKAVLQPHQRIMRLKDVMCAPGLHGHAQRVLDMGTGTVQIGRSDNNMVEQHGTLPPKVFVDRIAGSTMHCIAALLAEMKGLLGSRRAGPIDTCFAACTRRPALASSNTTQAPYQAAAPSPRRMFRMCCAASGMFVPGPKIALTPAS